MEKVATVTICAELWDLHMMELRKTQEKLERTKAELVQTKVELEQTKAELVQTKAELKETKANANFVSSGYAKLLPRFEPPELSLLPPLAGSSTARELSKSSVPDKFLPHLQPLPPSDPQISERKHVRMSLRKYWDAPSVTTIAEEERDAVMHTFQKQLDDIDSIHLASDFVTALHDIQHQVNELKYVHHLNFTNHVSVIESKIKELRVYKEWCR